MRNISLPLLIIIYSLLLVLFMKHKDSLQKEQIPINQPVPTSPFDNTPTLPPIEEPIEDPTPSTPEPDFENYPPLRRVTNLGKVLSDIDSHMPEGHIYRDDDKITWGHETTHGINSHMRMKFSRSYNGQLYGVWIRDLHGHPVFKSFNRINAFYVLEDRGVVIEEPSGTLTDVANTIPKSLRGDVYNLYLIQQARDWNDTPLYVFDEWTAYANGAEVRIDLDIKQRSETVLFTLEFNVYSICVAMASQSQDEQLKKYLMWNLKRSMDLYQTSKEKFGTESDQEKYLETMRTAHDAGEFRQFAKNYFGEDWTQEVLGF